VTSPEISQVFGELIGLWAASAWHAMEQPENVRLVELGPGRGTMMLDALRAAQVVPAFRRHRRSSDRGQSGAARAPGQVTFGGIDVPVVWHETFDEVPDGPIDRRRQRVRRCAAGQPGDQAVQRLVRARGRDRPAGNLAFGISDEQIPLFEQMLPPQVRDAPVGSVYEWRNDHFALGIGQRAVSQNGAALLIDYGHVESAAGETLQAVGAHAFANPLLSPGEVDLTAHVDFQALAEAAERMGARTFGPIDQAQFLRNLGVAKRAQALKAYAPREKADEIDGAVNRLLGEGRGGMGNLFKASPSAAPKLGTLPGFEPVPQ
jgi:NADH dehydrogenase [ubiquinone] 1 alpha subcomplex assembly factor 7